MTEKDLKKAEKEVKATAEQLKNIDNIMARQMGPKVEVSNEEYEQLGNENQNNQQSEKEILKEKRKELIKRFNFELNLIQVKKQELILQKNESNSEEINKQINELNNYEKKLKEDMPHLSGMSEYLRQSKFFNGIKNHQKIVKSIKNILDKLSIQTTLKGINDHINILEEELKNSNINEKLKNDLIEKIEEKRKNINENNKTEIASKIVEGTKGCIIKPYELGKKSIKYLIICQKTTISRFEQMLNGKPKFLLNQQQKENIINKNSNQQTIENKTGLNTETTKNIAKKNNDNNGFQIIEKNINLIKTESVNRINNSDLNAKIQNLKKEKNLFARAWDFLKSIALKFFFKKITEVNNDMEKQFENKKKKSI